MITYLVATYLALMYYLNIITFIMVPMWMPVGQNYMPFIKNVHITVISNKRVHGPSLTSFPEILITVQCNNAEKTFQVASLRKHV
jgi:hypothetical protein